jgi:hypothetical protein
MDKEFCGKCKCFFRRKSLKDGTTKEYIWVGLCRSNPPQIAVVDSPSQQGNVVGTVSEIVSHWPSVREYDWCSNFIEGERDQSFKADKFRADEKDGEGGYH